MKERPILFSAPMVRAILTGSKTQTRRALRVQPGDETTVHVEHFNQTVVDRHSDEHPGPEVFGAWWDDGESGLRCPYGQPGDRLWVREAFGHFERNENFKPGAEVFYRADGNCLELEPWRPSIHMPRWASRITLEITSVRVERLQGISEADALAEGVDEWSSGAMSYDGHCHYSPDEKFRLLWESINGYDAWCANPWVWAIEFRRAAA